MQNVNNFYDTFWNRKDDWKREDQPEIHQCKQHLNDKADLKNHISKLESEINNKNNEVSLLFKQLEENGWVCRQNSSVLACMFESIGLLSKT